MAKMVTVSAQKRSTISKKILKAINEVGQDNVIQVVMDEGGKFLGGTWFASIKAYIYYKN